MLFPSSSFSCCNAWGCSKRQRHNAGTLQKSNVVASDSLSWGHFPLKWLLSPKCQIFLPCLVLIPPWWVFNSVDLLAPTLSHTTATNYDTPQKKADSRSLPLLGKQTLENRKPLGILMEVVRNLFSGEHLSFSLRHRPGKWCGFSTQAQLLHWHNTHKTWSTSGPWKGQERSLWTRSLNLKIKPIENTEDATGVISR